MTIRVISESSLVEWNEANGTDLSLYDLTDEQFLEINEEYEDGWCFNSWEEYVNLFNLDDNSCPVPSCHFLRVFKDDEDLTKKFLDLIREKGEDGQLFTFDLCCDKGFSLADSTIDAVVDAGDAVIFYYNKNTNDFDGISAFSVEDLKEFYDKLILYL